MPITFCEVPRTNRNLALGEDEPKGTIESDNCEPSVDGLLEVSYVGVQAFLGWLTLLHMTSTL